MYQQQDKPPSDQRQSNMKIRLKIFMNTACTHPPQPKHRIRRDCSLQHAYFMFVVARTVTSSDNISDNMCLLVRSVWWLIAVSTAIYLSPPPPPPSLTTIATVSPINAHNIVSRVSQIVTTAPLLTRSLLVHELTICTCASLTRHCERGSHHLSAVGCGCRVPRQAPRGCQAMLRMQGN